MRLAVLAALFALSGCTATDTGWHLAGTYRAPDENLNPARLSRRPIPASAIVAGSNGEALHFRRPRTGTLMAEIQFGPEAHFAHFGGLERHIPLQAWRGRKLSVQLRLRNEGNAMAFVMAQVNRLDGAALRTAIQGNAPSESDWRQHQLVLEVPDNATTLFVHAGFTGSGEFWLDGLKLEPAPAGAPPSKTYALDVPSPESCRFSRLSRIGPMSDVCGPINDAFVLPPDEPRPPPPPPPPPPEPPAPTAP